MSSWVANGVSRDTNASRSRRWSVLYTSSVRLNRGGCLRADSTNATKSAGRLDPARRMVRSSGGVASSHRRSSTSPNTTNTTSSHAIPNSLRFRCATVPTPWRSSSGAHDARSQRMLRRRRRRLQSDPPHHPPMAGNGVLHDLAQLGGQRVQARLRAVAQHHLHVGRPGDIPQGRKLLAPGLPLRCRQPLGVLGQ